MDQTDYKKFRGKCKEMSMAACESDPSLRLVRGHYFCPFTNKEEQHWWCEDQGGNVVDPSKDQFLSRGQGTYTEFSGKVNCAECGKELAEKSAKFYGRYPLCPDSTCILRFVGL